MKFRRFIHELCKFNGKAVYTNFEILGKILARLKSFGVTMLVALLPFVLKIYSKLYVFPEINYLTFYENTLLFINHAFRYSGLSW